MKKINVFIVHGIGINQEGYADAFIEVIRNKFNSHIQTTLNSTENFTEEINLKPIVWDKILGEKQKKLKTLLQKQFVIGQIQTRNKFLKIAHFLLKVFIDKKLRTKSKYKYRCP